MKKKSILSRIDAHGMHKFRNPICTVISASATKLEILPSVEMVSLRIWSISSYSVRMQENAEKIQTRITPNTDTFYAAQRSRLRNYEAVMIKSSTYKQIKKI